jgi:cardiolipin synthase
MTNRRVLGPAEAGIMVWGALAILLLVVVGLVWPRVIVVPLALIGLWVGASLLVRAHQLRRQQRRSSRRAASGLR